MNRGQVRRSDRYHSSQGRLPPRDNASVTLRARDPNAVVGNATHSPVEALPNIRHERFAEFVACGRNVTHAYMEVFPDSSYDAARSSGPRLLANVRISARVAHLSDQIEREAISAASVSRERVLSELAQIGFSNISDFLVVGPDGLPRPTLENLTTEQAAALAEVTVESIPVPGQNNDGSPLPPVVRFRLKLHNKISALQKLGQHLRLFSDVADTADPDRADRSQEALRRFMMRLLDLRAQGKLPPEVMQALDDWAGVPAQKL